jgi:transcriptional regulator of heat shock response
MQLRLRFYSSPIYVTNFEPRKKRVRIIYRISKSGVIDIVAIGPRRMIYEENFRLVKRQIGE